MWITRCLQLAISPKPRTSTDPVSVSFDTQLTLKVEGVVTHNSQPGMYRSVQSVRVNVR